MSQTMITIGVRHINPSISIFDIQGDLTASAENILIDTYTHATTATTHTIILNFTHMAYMNSSGIGLLVTLLIRIHRNKQQLFCYGLSQHYRHIFDLTRLNDVIQIFLSEQQALAAA